MDTGSSGEILNQYADDGADLDATKEGGDSLKQDDKQLKKMSCGFCYIALILSLLVAVNKYIRRIFMHCTQRY